MNQHIYADLLNQALTVHAKKSCMHIKREGQYQSWTFAQFRQDLNRLTALLQKHGLKPGVNGIVIGENTPEWIIAYHAILLTGASTVPVDPNIPPSEIESIAALTEARVVFCSRVYIGLFRTLKEKYHFIDKIVLLDTHANEKEPRFDQFIAHGDEEKDAFSHRFDPDDPMVIIFTSGTTGKAKGVVLTQKNFTVISLYGVPRMKVTPDDTVAAVLPLHHVFGFAACIAGPLIGGMDVVCIPYLKGPLIVEALRDKGITMLPAVPKLISLFYDSVLHNVKKKGPAVATVFAGMKTISATAGDILGQDFKRTLFSSVHKGFGGKLNLIVSGGASLGKKYWNGFRQMGFIILEGYGLSETFGPVTVSPPDDVRLGSVGPILPENELRIDLPNDAGIGEVTIKGTCVFKGYYKRDDLTGEVIDTDGWFHTGDLGRLDKDGYLYLVGRKKDVIILDNGKNVYPDELEDYYSVSEHIEDIGVFGVKQEEGEIVAAVIVPSKAICKAHTVQKATEILYNELVRLGKNIPVHRRITDFVTVYQPLPRTTTRKLKKPELLKLYNSIRRKSGNRPVPEEQLSVIEMALIDTGEYTGVIDGLGLVSPRTDTHIVNPRSHLEIDLGLDSLMRIELLSQLERRFSVVIPEDVFDKMETVGDLVTLVREQRTDSGRGSGKKVMDLKERILADTIGHVKLPDGRNSVSRFVRPALLKMAHAMIGVEATGIEQITHHHLPLIFVANHAHVLDAFWILNSLPHQTRSRTFLLGASETARYPVLPYALHSPNIIRGERGDPIEMLKIALAIIRSKKHLLVFPEGEISKNDGVGEFKSGIGLLARETGAAIVPVRVQSAGNNPKSAEAKPGVLFGKSVTVSELISSGSIQCDSSADDISTHIRSIIAAM